MEVLERFKRSHRTSACTCRLGACARATIGFEDEVSRGEHEKGHVKHLYCEEPGCQYPPFPTPHALKYHVNNDHGFIPTTPRPIRQSHSVLSHSINPPPSAQGVSTIFSGRTNSPELLTSNGQYLRPELVQFMPFLTEGERKEYVDLLTLYWGRRDQAKEKGKENIKRHTETRIKMITETIATKVENRRNESRLRIRFLADVDGSAEDRQCQEFENELRQPEQQAGRHENHPQQQNP
jgi:hypothetical protein